MKSEGKSVRQRFLQHVFCGIAKWNDFQELVLKVYFETILGICTPKPGQIFPGSSKSGGGRQGCLRGGWGGVPSLQPSCQRRGGHPLISLACFFELKRGRRHLINLITAFLTNILENQVKFFHQRRLQELRQSLIFYVEVSVHLSWSQLKFYCLSLPQLRYNGFTKAETQFCISFLIYQGQIKCSRESQASLTGCLAKMKEFSVPQVEPSSTFELFGGQWFWVSRLKTPCSTPMTMNESGSDEAW